MAERFVVHGEHPDKGEFVFGNDADGPFETADEAQAWLDSQGGPADGFLVTIMQLVPVVSIRGRASKEEAQDG